MNCRHCKKPITGEYVEEWSGACPAHHLGYAHVECSRKASRYTWCLFALFVVVVIVAAAIIPN